MQFGSSYGDCVVFIGLVCWCDVDCVLTLMSCWDRAGSVQALVTADSNVAADNLTEGLIGETRIL